MKRLAKLLVVLMMGLFVFPSSDVFAVDCYAQLESDINACTANDTGISVVLLPLCYTAAAAAFTACTVNAKAQGPSSN